VTTQILLQEKLSGAFKYMQNRLAAGLRPVPRWGSLQRSPRLPSWWEGAGCPPPQKHHLRFRPFGPCWPHNKSCVRHCRQL